MRDPTRRHLIPGSYCQDGRLLLSSHNAQINGRKAPRLRRLPQQDSRKPKKEGAGLKLHVEAQPAFSLAVSLETQTPPYTSSRYTCKLASAPSTLLRIWTRRSILPEHGKTVQHPGTDVGLDSGHPAMSTGRLRRYTGSRNKPATDFQHAHTRRPRPTDSRP